MYRDPVGHRIKTLNNLMKRTMDKKFGHRPDRATLMHTWIIGFLDEREELGVDTFQKDIESEFSINRSTTSEMLKLMCKKGMIQRVPVAHDARLKKIVLTDLSREFNKRMSYNMEQIHNQLIEGLSQEEIETFIKISDKLIDNIRKGL
ncbi:MAG: winged helix-turn-helix transcriptional regulator [Coprobacillus cateniformis]|uniref:DNA-binding MarR family transcriptional regulator n=1 Tax=Longibaculum muris TaxID=1796628 RepID=A0A4R3ZAA2_9FIRM|nr:MarR family winged helix-turn-helix transcriptional regulator [Longibaculum muris]KXU50705.1 transcriptional regulator, MarR family [Candidatus Stoquefichus sp. KLE1796]MBS5111495.1 winged helix-turn-helix transcriptional regulator [Coprobacillus cateniformis]MBS5368541.1 winged helix-turn-helix transcriptional regulator [Coprobacillus cateniformis]MCR1887359.1 MarR family winged helix-turn-helix transcriptional regulator [Longibaculum muris]MED9812260.1 MarR family winged helix-turn-helix 